MRHLPQYFYEKSILSLVDSFINNGFDSFDRLKSTDQDAVIARCVDALGGDSYSCMIESENFKVSVSSFIKYLLNGNHSNAYDLANSLRKNAAEYFSDDLNTLFEERSSILESESFSKNGLLVRRHKDNGERYFLKV